MFSNIDTGARIRWRASRAQLETRIVKAKTRSTVFGALSAPKLFYTKAVDFIIRLSGLHGRGKRNARVLSLSEVEFYFPDLPESFDGYTILHLSDIHIGHLQDPPEKIAETLSGLDPDLVVMTGDFQTLGVPSGKQAANMMGSLISGIRSRDGWLAVLGNHDTHDMLDALEEMNVRGLANESVVISRNDEELHIVGTDDVHSFYTPEAINALERHRDNFRIALVHTVDLVTIAANSGYSLYLSGHTHGGQICLPGGRPVFTALDSHHHLASGRWKHNSMHGYTSRGLGHGIVPVRFNCPGEIALIRLRKGSEA